MIRHGGINMTEDERSIGKRWFDQVWNQGRREAIGEMFPSHGVLHDGAHVTTGPGAFYQFYDRLQSAFSDCHVAVEDTIAEGYKLVVRWVCTARHTGDGLGVPPTDKAIQVSGISILRLAGSQIVEAWQNWDMLGMMEQIKGAVDSPTYVAEPAHQAR